jgi:Retinal pigment epithelial membrane protein
VVVYNLPVTFDPKAIRADLDPTSPTVFPYRWNADYQARVGVLPRDGTIDALRWFEITPCYLFHTMNAYEDNGRIVIDVVRHPRMFASERPGPNEDASTLDRWTIDLKTGRVFEERLDDRAQEFPRIDERLTGRRHRYGYSLAGKLQSAATCCTSTTSILGARRRDRLDPEQVSASSCSLPLGPTLRKTTASSWATSTMAVAGRVTSCSSTPGRWTWWRRCICPCGCSTAFMETGFPTTPR